MGQIASKVTKLVIPEREECPSHTQSEDGVGTSQPVVFSSALPAYPLATPRRPLHRTRKSITPPQTPPIEPSSKRLRGEVQYLDFPFLNDNETINFVQHSKVMFIMKGLPGSGKSFISQKIQEVYENCVVCSADFYFMKNGQYQFDGEKLKDAHKSCQHKATTAAEANCNVIVIDNNNLRYREMKFYLDLASTCNYIPLVVEPHTSWSMTCSELAARNAHGLSEEIIAKKMKSYQPQQPIYYGWFLNYIDSEKIQSIGQEWLQQVLNVEDCLEDFLQHLQVGSSKALLSLFRQNCFVGGGNMLHATAKFTGRGKVEGAKEYISSHTVKCAMGQSFRLHIIGFVITPRTFGARLKLTQEQLELWANDYDDDLPTPAPHPQSLIDNIQPEHIEDTDQSRENEEKTKHLGDEGTTSSVTTILMDADNENNFHPTSGKGRRAHLTLACVHGVKPVTTGLDLLHAITCEQRALESQNHEVKTYEIKDGVLRNYGDGIWVVYPKCTVIVSSLFSALY